MLKKMVQLVIILLSPVLLLGQSSPDFNILADKAFQKLYQNPDDCINYSLSILISDKNPEHKIVLRNIISQAYAMKGDYVQSVNMSSQKEEADEGVKLSYFMKMFDDYNLADQYQNLDLYNQSQRIISSILSNQKLLNSEDKKIRITIAKLYQLQALNMGINRHQTAALENLNKSDQYISNHNEENKIIGFENRIFRSSFFLRQNQPEEARKIIEGVILNLKQENLPFLTALAHENFSRYYFLQGDYQSAIQELDKGLLTLRDLPYNTLKNRIYESLSKNYFALHNDEKYHEYNNLYRESHTKIDSSTKEGIRYIVKLVENSQNKSIVFQKQHQLKQIWMLISIFSLIIISLLIYYLILKNKKKDLKKQFDFFERQKRRKISASIHENLPNKEEIMPIDRCPEKDSNKISKEKEDEILQKLEEWEETDQYLSKSMSLSMLSAQMGVNTKYLSEAINNNKGKILTDTLMN